MTPVLIVVIVAVAIALTIRSARRALAERDAVDRHRSTLDILGTLADRVDKPDRGADRGDKADKTDRAGRADRPNRGTRVERPVTPPDDPAPDDSRPADRRGAPPAAAVYQPRHRAPRRRRRLLPGLALAAALGALLGGGLFLRSRQHHAPASASPAPATTLAPIPTPIQSVPTTANTAPVVLLSSDSQQAHFSVRRPSVNLELVLTGPCWVEIRSTLGTGPIIFVGTLRAGTRRTLPTTAASGGLRVRLGNPAGVSVSVDGSILAVPRPSGTQPFTLFFQPLS